MQKRTHRGDLCVLPGQTHRTKELFVIPRRSLSDVPPGRVVQIPKYIPTNSHVPGTIAFALLYSKQR